MGAFCTLLTFKLLGTFCALLFCIFHRLLHKFLNKVYALLVEFKFQFSYYWACRNLLWFIYFCIYYAIADNFIYLQLEKSYQHFTAFYAQQHIGRKLSWLYHMSKGEIITNCFKNRYTFQVFSMYINALSGKRLIDRYNEII